MKYAIYDKAADGYLTSMECNTDIHGTEVKFNCGYNEYITEAKLLDTKEEASNMVVRIYSLKFMEKGRFVVHSFDDGWNDQYIISRAGDPTKVVDNITVDLNGTINVKYGTMVSHWSTVSLYDVIDRMNALWKAASEIHTSWNDTFDIYKVITIMDEKEHAHYQFINVTKEGLDGYAKEDPATKEITDITKPLHKRIDELEKALDDQKKLNEAFNDTIVRYRNERRDMDKEIKELCTMRDCLANIIYAIRNTICDNNGVAFDYIESQMSHDSYFNSDPFMGGVRENIKDICTTEKRNIANHELNNRETARLTEERDKDLERAEKFKGIANSIYGISIPSRCCGKQMFYDITTGKKILVDKEKYDDLVECVNNINTTYDILKCVDFTFKKPIWLDGIERRINNLTK